MGYSLSQSPSSLAGVKPLGAGGRTFLSSCQLWATQDGSCFLNSLRAAPFYVAFHLVPLPQILWSWACCQAGVCRTPALRQIPGLSHLFLGTNLKSPVITPRKANKATPLAVPRLLGCPRPKRGWNRARSPSSLSQVKIHGSVTLGHYCTFRTSASHHSF